LFCNGANIAFLSNCSLMKIIFNMIYLVKVSDEFYRYFCMWIIIVFSCVP
jgi:hypothetical protein